MSSLPHSSNSDHYQLPCAVPMRWNYITKLLSERIESPDKLLNLISRLRSNTEGGKSEVEIAEEESRVEAAETLAAAAAKEQPKKEEDEADARATFRHPPQPSLYYFFHDYCPVEVRENFFANVLPKLQKLALELPKLFPSQQLPRLREPENATHETSFSRKQILCLVAHMFFCTLDKQSVEYWASYSALYDWWKSEPILAYLRVLIEYFAQRTQQLTEEDPMLEQVIHVKRCAARQSREAFGEEISKSTQPLCNLTMGGLCNFHDVNFYKAVLTPSSASITACDALASELLEIDFANKDISWGRGGTQEELLLGMSPETHVLPLLLDTLQDHEAVYISNVQRIGEYKGYGCDAMFKNTFHPPTWPDNSSSDTSSKGGFPLRSIGGMDALNLWEELIENRKKQGKTFEEEEYDSPIVHLELMQLQSQENMILRDIIKSFVTFSSPQHLSPPLQSASSSSSPSSSPLVVLTGPWGCSSFGGNLFLKLLIQWMAASLAGVSELRYQTFQHVEALESEVAQLLPWLRGEHREKVTVGLLFQSMKEWSAQLSAIQPNATRRFEFDAQQEGQKLFQLIRQKLEAQL